MTLQNGEWNPLLTGHYTSTSDFRMSCGKLRADLNTEAWLGEGTDHPLCIYRGRTSTRSSSRWDEVIFYEGLRAEDIGFGGNVGTGEGLKLWKEAVKKIWLHFKACCDAEMAGEDEVEEPGAGQAVGDEGPAGGEEDVAEKTKSSEEMIGASSNSQQQSEQGIEG